MEPAVLDPAAQWLSCHWPEALIVMFALAGACFWAVGKMEDDEVRHAVKGGR